MLNISENKEYIIIFVVILFYSFLGTYLSTQRSAYINPKNLLFLSIPLILYLNFTMGGKLNFLKVPIVKWIILYVVMVLFWYLLPNNYMEDKGFRRFVFSTLYFISMIILISNDDDNFSKTRTAILLVTMLAIFNNIYEFFNPFAFYAMGSEYSIPGRSAGFYVDSNSAGQAILFGLIFTYSIVPKKLKVAFLFLTLLGIVVTFSRGSIVGWILIVSLLFFYKQIDKRDSLTVIIIFLLGILFLLPLLYEYITSSFNYQADNLINRLNFFSDSGTTDSSEVSRMHIVKVAFALFADNPIFGAGLSIIRHWEYHIAPHNTYIAIMVQFGIVGLISYFYLIFTLVANAKNETKIIARIFLIYFLFLGLFIHSILTDYHIIIAMILMSNMSYRSNKNYKEGQNG